MAKKANERKRLTLEDLSPSYRRRNEEIKNGTRVVLSPEATRKLKNELNGKMAKRMEKIHHTNDEREFREFFIPADSSEALRQEAKAQKRKRKNNK